MGLVENGYVTTAYAAARLGCSIQTVVRMLHKGYIEGKKLDGLTASWLIHESSVADWERYMAYVDATTVSAQEAAEQTGAELGIVYAAVWEGALCANKVKGRWRIDRESLKTWKPPVKEESGAPPVYSEDVVARAKELHEESLSFNAIVAALQEEFDVSPDQATVRGWVKGRMRKENA